MSKCGTGGGAPSLLLLRRRIPWDGSSTGEEQGPLSASRRSHSFVQQLRVLTSAKGRRGAGGCAGGTDVTHCSGSPRFTSLLKARALASSISQVLGALTALFIIFFLMLNPSANFWVSVAYCTPFVDCFAVKPEDK